MIPYSNLWVDEWHFEIELRGINMDKLLVNGLNGLIISIISHNLWVGLIRSHDWIPQNARNVSRCIHSFHLDIGLVCENLGLTLGTAKQIQITMLGQ